MHPEHATFSPPTWRLTRWLAEAPAGTPDGIRAELLRGLFGTLPIFFGGVFNTVLVAAAVTARQPTPAFISWLVLEVAICLARLVVLLVALRAARQDRRTPTDLHLVLTLVWGGSAGWGVFLGLVSGDWVVATLICLSAAAMVGGMCLRHFNAPRLASLMIVMGLGPTCPAALLAGEPIMLVVFAQVPFYLTAMSLAAFKLNRMFVSTLIAERESGHRARHDDLTGLANRASLTRSIEEHLSRPDPAGTTLLYLDLDGFKQVNDSQGHAAGDRLLQLVAGRIAASVRAGDMTARIGGDEFVVLANRLSPEEAMALGTRVAGRVAGVYEADGIACEIGVSIGIARAPDHGDDVRSLLAAADRALYVAKGRGRCHVVMQPSPEAAPAPSIVPAPDGGAGALWPVPARPAQD